MKQYTNETPVFSESIYITEISDPAHADNINEAPIQLLQNTLVNRELISYLSSLMLRYSYHEDMEIISCVASHGYADETLEFPNGMAYMDREVAVFVFDTETLGNIQLGNAGSSYVLPAATADTLGGVKIGTGIKRLADGTISVDTEGVAESVIVQATVSAAERAAEIVERNATEPSDTEIDGLFAEEVGQ